MKKRVFLIGGYKKTKSLAVSLLKKGYEVTAINGDMEKCVVLSEIDDLAVIHGDGSKPYVLEEANAYNADIAIALTESDADNLVICELCKKKFRVKKTVALITDSKKSEFFYRMGIDSVVCAITAIANIIEQQAFLDEIATLVPLGEGRVRIAQVPIPQSSPAVDKMLWEIKLPREVLVGCILRGEKSLVPRGETRVLAGDVLVLISSDEHEKAAVRELTGA
ncbi:MAG: TrkA family potassium uptake protein [Clostridiales bacterium]|jgi:trk system potassium uptake protein TrkA|nr:TrkA family potassium uptake protein [Clostridiales bacterium]